MVAPSVAVDQIVAFLTRAVLTARARAKEECVERDVVELNAMYVALLREVGYVYEARCPTHMDCPTTDQCYLKLQYAKCLHVVRCVSAVLQTLFSNVSTLELSPVFSLNIFDALISRARMEIKRNYEHRCVKPEAPRHIKNVMTSVYLYQIPEDQVAQQLEEDLKQKLTNLKPCSASLDFYKEAAVKDHDVLYQTIVHFILVINKLLKQSSLQEEEPKEEIVQEAQMFWNNLRDTVFSKRLDEVDWFSVFDPGNLQVDLIEKLDNQVWNVFLCIYEGDVRSVLEANRMILKAILTALLDVLRAKCGMVSQKKRDSWSLSPTSPQYQIPGNNHSNAYVMIELELQSVADMLFIMRQTRNGFGLKDVVQNEPQTVEQRDDEEDNEEIDNLLDKVAKLEEEKDDVVNEYTSKLRIANEQLKYEEQYKKKLLEEIMNMREMNEQTVAALKQSEEERITQIKTQHVAELKKLKDEHYNEMEEDKYAMKRTLDAVRRAHEEELTQVRQQNAVCACSEGCSTTSDDTRASESSHVADRLKSISAQYSAKCLEHSQLEEKVSMLMTERRNVEAKSEMELKRMQKEMSSKDQVIEDLKETVDRLEKKLWEKGSSAQGPQNAPEAEQFETAPSTPVAAAPLPIRFRQSPPPPRLASRRTDVRFHSNPAIPVMRDPEIHGYTADEVRHSLAVPVRERLKFFEHIAEYQMSF